MSCSSPSKHARWEEKTQTLAAQRAKILLFVAAQEAGLATWALRFVVAGTKMYHRFRMFLGVIGPSRRSRY